MGDPDGAKGAGEHCRGNSPRPGTTVLPTRGLPGGAKGSPQPPTRGHCGHRLGGCGLCCQSPSPCVSPKKAGCQTHGEVILLREGLMGAGFLFIAFAPLRGAGPVAFGCSLGPGGVCPSEQRSAVSAVPVYPAASAAAQPGLLQFLWGTECQEPSSRLWPALSSMVLGLRLLVLRQAWVGTLVQGARPVLSLRSAPPRFRASVVLP